MGEQTVDKILAFWFADIGEGFDIGDMNRLWFGASVEMDQQIDRQFGKFVTQALSGQLNTWANTAQSALALILLLDQLPRNIYRKSREAFAGDQQARDIVQTGLAGKLDRQLSYMQRTFFYMPLEHSESLEDQHQCVDLFECLLVEVPEQGKKIIESSLGFAVQHREIIERFGRFPHRNEVLGRISTQQELEYLQANDEWFGQ